MAIIKNKDKITGITYVYESKSYGDSEKKQSRAVGNLLDGLTKKPEKSYLQMGGAENEAHPMSRKRTNTKCQRQ